MGLPPTSRDDAMHPLIIPEEPEIREMVGNELYGMEVDATLESVISSLMDSDDENELCKEMYHAIIESDSDESAFSDNH